MILWLALFALVVAISFVLALQSMHDYHEFPQYSGSDYGLFLIRNTAGLTTSVLDSIHNRILQNGLIVSLERLFKGTQSALVIFGPKEILTNFSSQLNLLELEDYTHVDREHVSAWEVGVKASQFPPDQAQKIDSFFDSFPMLSEAEQFWWQLTLQAQPNEKVSKAASVVKGIFGKPRSQLSRDRFNRSEPDTQSEIDYLMRGKGRKLFQSQIRAVVISAELSRRKKLAEILQNLPAGSLTKIPQPFTSAQITQFYKSRSLSKGSNNPTLAIEEVLKLSLLSPKV